MALCFLSKQWTLILFTLIIVLMIQIRYDLFSQYSSKYSNSPFCASSNEASKGNWIVKTDLTRYEIEERKRLDIEIRKSMNWPANMFRNDSRCGKQYPIPGYRLQGQCNPESFRPCCNQEIGMCGKGPEYCNCQSCTDLREMIPAEIATWVPNTCVLREMNSDEICTLFSAVGISLTFLGDSLIRHIHTMMLLFLADNYFDGSLPLNITEEERQTCQGESQITNKKCSVEIVAQNVDELPEFSVCSFVKSKMTVEIVQDYHTTLIPKVSEKIDELFEKENSFIICGVGLHYQLEFDIVKKEYLEKIWSKLKSSKNGWPKLIWISIHGIHGFLRLATRFANQRIENFNKKVQKYWAERNVAVVDTYEISKRIKSYDGRHYGFGLNKLKIQLILLEILDYYSEYR